MSETTGLPDTGPLATTTPQQPSMAATPAQYVIPTQVLEPWLKVPPGAYVELRATRHDIDLLFFGLMNAFNAQLATHQCLVDWTNGDIAAANIALQDARSKVASGQNEIRQFIAALMASAKPSRSDG